MQTEESIWQRVESFKRMADSIKAGKYLGHLSYPKDLLVLYIFTSEKYSSKCSLTNVFFNCYEPWIICFFDFSLLFYTDFSLF